MAVKRMTKDDAAQAFGVFAPVGHVVIGFPDDDTAARAAQALRGQQGFDGSDVLQYKASEESSEMERRLDGISGMAEFGHEVVLMRKYKELADQGCGWLVVYAPEKVQCGKLLEVARQHGAVLAERYGNIVVEDLL